MMVNTISGAIFFHLFTSLGVVHVVDAAGEAHDEKGREARDAADVVVQTADTHSASKDDVVEPFLLQMQLQ